LASKPLIAPNRRRALARAHPGAGFLFVVKFYERQALCPLSPNGLFSSTQANWANRAKFDLITRADFSELLAAQ
jgi:hypothetical protein